MNVSSCLYFPDEVAVVDEIQMIRDPGRGWAWTRGLLGLNAKEVHVCGEASSIGLVKELAMAAGEEVEVRVDQLLRHYLVLLPSDQRLTKLP